MKDFKIVWKLLKKEKWKLILAAILFFICEICSMLTGYLNGSAVEAISNLEIKVALIYLGVYFISEILSNAILRVMGNSMLSKLENSIEKKIGYETYKKTLNLPSYAFEKTSSGEIINRITNDADTLSSSFGELIDLACSIIGSLALIIYIFIESWIIGIEIIIFVILLFIVIRKYKPMLESIRKEQRKEEDKYSSLVNESIRGIREIKVLGIKNNLIVDISNIIKTIFNKSKEGIDIQKRFDFISRVLRTILEVGVFSTCVVLLYYDKISLTFFIAMTYYVYRYTWLIDCINSFTKKYQRVKVSLTRINEILENKLYEDENFGDIELNNVLGNVEFKDVTFGYPEEEIILKHFNLRLEPNKKIAIVGKSGQGKSTLFNLMTRIFEPLEGEILLDGVNIKELTEQNLRENISLIRQEPFVFNRTIKENFELINKNITIEEIRKFTKMAYLDDYIMSLPKNYDTILGEGGVNLSGGQKQRLAIARTLAKKK